MSASETREPTLLASMLEGERRDITWPCAKALNAGETIVDAEVDCVWDHGAADPTPGDRIALARQIVGTDVVQRFAADVPGVWYRVWALIELSSGRKLAGECIFFVKPLPSVTPP